MRFKQMVFTLFPILYMIFIWFLSSHPADAFVKTPFSFDHLLKESLHLIEFAILYLLIALAFITNGKWTKKASIFAAVISVMYGAIDEIHQSFIPYRSATLIDFIKDTAGVAVAYFMMNKKYFK
ncbi:VanZ family protein [Metabacillus fastidiosus]|uniref:VanZ family protein n=1 Tax=Metabacillus fastidiosus TaxID=1458 RepID=UPI003D29A8AC